MTAMHQLLSGKILLVVEDDAMIAVYIADLLADIGCTSIRHAHDIASAIADLKKQKPDLVLLDLRLGNGLSYPIARFLTAEKVPIIFTTGFGPQDLEDEWSKYPVLTKPYSSEALEAAIIAALKAAA